MIQGQVSLQILVLSCLQPGSTSTDPGMFFDLDNLGEGDLGILGDGDRSISFSDRFFSERFGCLGGSSASPAGPPAPADSA
eukprot:6736279-Pyramimonas_sp.AAC.1